MITPEVKDLFIAKLDVFNTMWLTLYGEARGSKIEEQIGVGNVICNRVAEGKGGIKEVCLAKFQFSCWNLDDPNLLALIVAFGTPSSFDSKIVAQLKFVAKGLISKELLDNTKDSNHYLTTALYRSSQVPKWAKDSRAKYNLEIGKSTFLWCP